jgi:hypothetical protein
MMQNMTTATRTRTRRPDTEQLSLLPESPLPVQFRLDRRTRERGLAHIAAIKAQLASRAAAASTTEPASPARAA